MTTDENRFTDIKKPIADKIPTAENEKATSKFINDMTCRLMDIADSIADDKSLNTCKSALLYSPLDNPSAGSHVDMHMPANDKSSSKLGTQVNAMNTMLRKNKTMNSCFVNEKSGYQFIINSLTDRTKEITDWLQSNYQGDHDIVLTTKEINGLIDGSQKELDNLGYGFVKDSRGHIDAFESQTMTVVLRKNECYKDNPLGFNGLGFHVYTAYPGQRQSSLNDELHGVSPMPEEDVMSVIKRTQYYRDTTDMNRALLYMQASTKIQIPSQINVYHDPHKDAIVICGPDYIDKTNENAQCVQKRYFIQETKKGDERTRISAALYTKDANDTEAQWQRSESLKYPDCAPERMAKYINSTQKRIDRQLEKLETQRAQKNTKVESITQNIYESQTSINGTELQ